MRLIKRKKTSKINGNAGSINGIDQPVLVAHSISKKFFERSLFKNKKFLFVVIIVLVALLGWLGWVQYVNANNQRQRENYKNLILDVSKLRANGKNNEAKYKLISYLSTNTKISNVQKSGIDNEIAVIFLTEKDYKNGIIWLEKSVNDNNRPSFNDYFNIAESALNLGDKPKAIKYYKLSLDILNSNNKVTQSSDSYKNYIKMQLSKLGEK